MLTVSLIPPKKGDGKKKLEIAVAEGEATLYEGVLCAADLELPHGCLAGACGVCCVEVLQGAENFTPPGPIEKDTLQGIKEGYQRKHGQDFPKGKVIRLTCRSKICGDVEITPWEK